MALLTAFVGYFIYTEILHYLNSQTTTESDIKLIRTGSLLTGLYEAESLSKLALQTKTQENFTQYESKIDSLLMDIDVLKLNTEHARQKLLLDSVQTLLRDRVNNNNELRKLKLRSDGKNSLDEALRDFRRLEASLGKITAEALAPNYETLPPKAQDVIRDIADYLNENVPEEMEPLNRRQLDSVLQASKALITEAKMSESRSQQVLRRKEQELLKNDLAISQKLREIVSAIEEEVLLNSLYDNRQREEALQQSVRIAVIATVLGLGIVIFFTFLIQKDYWQVQNYRRQLEKQKLITESLLQSREQLISTVSHDLRTPLNAITGYSELMESTGLAPKQKNYLDHMRSAANYVDRLVNDLLDFSKLSSGKIKIEEVAFSLPDIIRETTENLEKIYDGKKEVALAVDIDPIFDQAVIGDPFRIRQILSNLIGNAFKFTREGRIEVIATGRENKSGILQTTIDVIDTGIGIPKEKQQLIFQEFRQADDQVERTYGGYGLGLTISKKLAELLAGSLSVQSKPGEGSKFTLQLALPVAPVSLKQDLPPIKMEDKLEAILIIDDDTSMLQLLEEMCYNLDIRPITFTNFDRLDTGAELSYQAVLTDIQMPGLDGFEVLNKLNSKQYSHFHGQPVFAMTGRRDLSTVIYREHGFSDALQKPFTKHELLKLLNNWFPSPKFLKGLQEPQTNVEPPSQLFSMENIYSFLGKDTEACAGVIETFISESRSNLLHLKRAIQKRDLTALNKVAHRMLPMFRQFKASACVPDLELLETLPVNEKPWPEIEQVYGRLERCSMALLEAQESYLNATSLDRSD